MEGIRVGGEFKNVKITGQQVQGAMIASRNAENPGMAKPYAVSKRTARRKYDDIAFKLLLALVGGFEAFILVIMVLNFLT